MSIQKHSHVSKNPPIFFKKVLTQIKRRVMDEFSFGLSVDTIYIWLNPLSFLILLVLTPSNH